MSRLTLISRTIESDGGFKIISNFGEISDVEAVGAIQGTFIEVRELFENIPARLKFLKSEAAELTQIKTIFKALGLKNPQVQFRLKANDKQVFFLAFRIASLPTRSAYS